jgi:two-component system chemotaxis response regulator CheB
MKKIKVLVVDDAQFTRRMLSSVLSEDPLLEVIATAANGCIALKKIFLLAPDLVVMDVDMPEMDGLDTLLLLREDWPSLPVIMFSGLTKKGASQTLDALMRGASDYVTKPEATGQPEDAFNAIRNTLIPKIKALCGQLSGEQVALKTYHKRVERKPSELCKIEIVVIGASTGGPEALHILLNGLPSNFPVPIVIVQHMPALFTTRLARSLDSSCALSVHEAQSGVELAAGKVYIAPGGHHLIVTLSGTKKKLALHQEAAVNSCRPSVDTTLISVADTYGASSLGVVLTGMGKDGLLGCENLVEKGSHVIVQDRASSVIWGMPGFVAQAGLADAVLPLKKIADEIMLSVQRGRAWTRN